MIIKGHKQDRVAIISSKHVTANISNKVDTIYSCDEPVSHLSSKQVLFIIRNTVHSCRKPAGRLREIMVMRMRTSMTTLGWILAATTSTNRSRLFCSWFLVARRRLHRKPNIVCCRVPFRFHTGAGPHASTVTLVGQPPYLVTRAGERLCLGSYSYQLRLILSLSSD